MTRREFARSASVAFVLPELLPGQACAQNKYLARKELKSLTKDEWNAFDKVVGTMMDTDKSWRPTAQIHDESCPHGNWFFLPWHRAYLYSFEQHARTICKDFALPYWDWTASPAFPTQFLEMPNLKRATRADANIKKPASDGVGQRTLDRVFSTAKFTSFGGGPNKDDPKDTRYMDSPGVLEKGPHAEIHRYVGQNLDKGGKDGVMYTDLAPLDPIFWVHHANVDRLWAQWCYDPMRPPQSKTWPDLKTSDWATKLLVFRIGGVIYTKKVNDCLSTFDLGYTYEGFGQNKKTSVVSFPDKDASRPRLLRIAKDELVTSKSATTVTVPAYTADDIKAMATTKAGKDKEDTTIAGEIRVWVEFAAVTSRGGVLKVYVNNPKADQKTGAEHRSYAGSIVFIPRQHGHNRSVRDWACVVLTEALRDTDYFKKPDVGISLTFVADSIAEGEDRVARIEGLNIEVFPAS